ncbi:MAG: tRNA1(Val) (adenine(37)-N6)-methyltransferase [Halanaerobiales bacterium]
MEEITILIPEKLNIIQDSRYFKFGNDSVFLAHFTAVRSGSMVVDFGTGSGVIPLLLAFKQDPQRIIGLEIQDKLVALARRSVEMNSLEDKIEIISTDYREASQIIDYGSVDLVVTNPPYMPVSDGKITMGKEKAIARHEIYGTLDDVIREGAAILRFGGKMTMVHKTQRMSEVIYTMKKYKLEPKRIRFIQSRLKTPPKTFLIESQKGARPGIDIEPVLLVYEEDSHEYTREVKEIYGEELV